MNKLSAVLVAATFALSCATAIAADPPKAPAAPTKTEAALMKPAGVTQDAWDKMSDADKKKAVDGAAKTAAPKKEKKGGC